MCGLKMGEKNEVYWILRQAQYNTYRNEEDKTGIAMVDKIRKEKSEKH